MTCLSFFDTSYAYGVVNIAGGKDDKLCTWQNQQ